MQSKSKERVMAIRRFYNVQKNPEIQPVNQPATDIWQPIQILTLSDICST